MTAQQTARPTAPPTSGSSTPPHPFRSAPWYDPTLHTPPAPPPARRSVGRIVLVLLAGVLLPLISILVNASMEIVALGRFGVALVVLSTLAVLANVIWVPVRRRPGGGPREVGGPASLWLQLLLLFGTVWTALWWGYLALLFLPILPISFVALIVMGLGFCGLCPYLATSVAIVQTLRVGRLLRARLSKRTLGGVIAAMIVVPVALAGAVALWGTLQDRALRRDLEALAKTPPYSLARMRGIEQLEGNERRLSVLFMDDTDYARRRLIAEAYQRLTDRTIDSALHRRGRRRGEIRPFFFVEARPVFSFNIFDPISRAL